MSKPCPFSFCAVWFDKYPVDELVFEIFLGVFLDAVSNNELFQALYMITKPFFSVLFFAISAYKTGFQRNLSFPLCSNSICFCLASYWLTMWSFQRSKLFRPPVPLLYHMEHIMISSLVQASMDEDRPPDRPFISFPQKGQYRQLSFGLSASKEAWCSKQITHVFQTFLVCIIFCPFYYVRFS